jgi:hypothetical protein
MHLQPQVPGDPVGPQRGWRLSRRDELAFELGRLLQAEREQIALFLRRGDRGVDECLQVATEDRCAAVERVGGGMGHGERVRLAAGPGGSRGPQPELGRLQRAEPAPVVGWRNRRRVDLRAPVARRDGEERREVAESGGVAGRRQARATPRLEQLFGVAEPSGLQERAQPRLGILRRGGNRTENRNEPDRREADRRGRERSDANRPE